MDIIAIFTGLAAIVSGVGGILLAIRAVRDKERKAAAAELKTVESLLSEERESAIKCETNLQRLKRILIRHSIPIPRDIEEDEDADAN